jgi:adhesin/invasin
MSKLKLYQFSKGCFLKQALFSKGCFFKRVLLGVIGAVVLSTSSYAWNWDCSKIYIARNNGGLFEYDPATGRVISSTPPSDPGDSRTIALGPVSSTDPTLRMYHWTYSDTNVYGNDAQYSNYGQTGWTNLGNPSGSFQIEGEGMSGGEVNQLTGEVYMTGPYTGRTGRGGTSGSTSDREGTFAIGVYNGVSTTSSRVLTTGVNYYIASDMAIDADGNAYVLARYGANSNGDWGLMRINIKDENGNFLPKPWIGEIVKSGLTIPTGDASNIWGLAFYNGKLYYTRSNGNLYVLDPLVGVATSVLATDGYSLDLAACQVSPIIRGKVYNDVEGDGVVSGAESGIDGLTVQLYSTSGTLLSTTTTANNGTYSFMINDSGNVDFYIRVKQPSINGTHIAQTWASGGEFRTLQSGVNVNTVYNRCTDFTNNGIESSSNRTCYGARADGADSDANTLTGANYYSRVRVTTSLAVPRVNFAFSAASDRSDSNINEVLHNTAVKDANNALRAYLGSGVTTDLNSILSVNADSDSYDDGIYVLLNGRYVPIQQRGFVQNKYYSFKADINGTKKSDAKLNVFKSPQTAPSWTALSSPADLSGTGDIITFTGTISGTIGSNNIIRARYSTSAGVSATSNVSTAAGNPWVLDGEVEDYQIYIVDRQIRLALKTVGTTGNSGNLTFNMSNVLTSTPSTTSAVISTNAPNVITDEPLGAVHRIQTANQPLSITVDKPQTLGIMNNETVCVDLSYGSENVPLSFNRYQSGGKWYDNVTLDSSKIRSDSDIICVFSYGTAPTVNVFADITLRAFTNDQFRLSIADVNTSTVIAVNTSTGTNSNVSAFAILEADHNNNISIAMAPGSTGQLNRYAILAVCSPGGQQMLTNGTFNISPTFGTETNCTITIGTSAVHTSYSEIAVIPNNNTAGNTSLVLITLKDGNNVTIPSGGDDIKVFIDSTVLMQLTNGTHSIYSPTTANITAIDYNNGSYSANISSNIAGSAVLRFSVNGDLSPKSAIAWFHHDVPDINNSNTNITIPYPNAGVSENTTAVVRVVDRFNNPVTNATVALYTVSTTTGGTPILYGAANRNDGSYEINLTSILQGSVTVSFSVNGVQADASALYKNATAVFTANNHNVTGPYTTIKAEPNVTNAGNISLITVYLADNDNNSVDGKSVTIFVNSANNASASISPIPSIGRGNGIYVANITSTAAGNYIVTFRVGSDISNKTANVLFQPNPPVLNNSSLSYITASSTVPAGANSTIKVYLADEYNNTISNATVTVRVLYNDSGGFIPAGSNNSISYTFDNSDSKGGYYGVLYSTTTAHNVMFGFGANGQLAPNSNNNTTAFTSGKVNITHENTTFAVTPHETGVGNSVTLRLHLVDDNSNPLSGYSVSFSNLSSVFENGSIGQSVGVVISAVTDHGNGTYSALATTNVSQNVTFDFLVSGVGTGSSVGKTDWAKFKSGNASLSHVNTTITATSSIEVNRNSTITVTLVDNNNNPVNNESVTMVKLSGANGVFSPVSATVTQDGSGNGKYIAYFTTPIAGTVTFGFVVGGNSNNSKNATTIFTSGGANVSTSELTFEPPTPSVSVEDNYTVIATIRDAGNNLVSGQIVTFRVSGGALSQYNCQTAADGKCSVTWTSTVANIFTINATINSNHITNSPAEKEFTAGVANETTSTFLLEPGPKTVGQSFGMNSTLRDKYGNAIPNQLVFYSVEPAIANAGFGAVGVESDSMNGTTGIGAIHNNNFWSNIAGGYKITVCFGSAAGPELSGSNQTAVFVPASPNQFASNLTVTGAGPVDSAGGYYTVRAYAKDNIGFNTIPNVNFNITVSNGTLSNGTLNQKSIICTTNALGYCEFLWRSPVEKGVFSVTAAFTNGTQISGSPAYREFISGSANASHSQLVILEPGPKIANGADNYTAVITLRDGNNIPTAGSVSVSVTGGLLDGTYTSQSYSVDPINGNVTIRWSSYAANNFTINASLNNELIVNGAQVREFITGPVNAANSNFTIRPLTSVIADNVSIYTLSVNIQDAYHNNKSGTVVTFNAAEGYLNNGTKSHYSTVCITVEGNCSVTWTSDRIGNFSVTALAEGVTIGKVEYGNFIQGAASLVTSNLTVTPPTPRIADNSTYFTAVAYIKDTLGHDITGEIITFRVTGGWIDNGTDRGTTLTCVSANGICTVYWRSDAPGNPTIIANITAGIVGSQQRQFIATNAAAANSSLEVAPSGPVVAGTGSYTALVTALDSGGVPAPGAIIQFEVSGGVLNSDNCETNSLGQCFVTWTSNQSGNFSINATIGGANLGGNGEPVKASPQHRVFRADMPTSANSTLVITPATNTVIANSGNYYTLNITARDQYGNAVPQQAINIYIGYGELNNGTGFAAGNSTCLTNDNGGCLVYWRSDKVGEFLVNATISGYASVINSSNEDKARRFSYDAVSTSNSYFTVTSYNASQPNNIPVCEEDEGSISLCNIYYNINAYIEDNSGNPMEGANVTFRIYRGGQEARDAYLNNTITDGFHGSEPGSYSCIMNAQGRCSANITLKANIAGVYQIYASALGSYIKGIDSNDVKEERTFVAAKASNQTSQIHFNPVADNSVESNNASYYNVTMEILDVHSNPINGAAVTLNVPLTSWLDNSTFVNSTVACVTAGSGNCSVLWRSVLAGVSQNITAQVQAITLEGSRMFKTGAPNPNTSNITVSAHNVTTDDTVTVIVTVNDAQGNPIKDTNYDVVIYTSLSNSSFAGGTGDHTGTLINVNGTYSAVLSSTKIGNTTLTFTINGAGNPLNFEWVYFNSGKVDINSSNNNSYIIAESPVDVGSDSLVTVYLGDKSGNPIDNLSVTIYTVDNSTNSTVQINGADNITINGGNGGNYTANLTAFNQGSATVSFIVNNINVNANDYGKNATVIFQTGTVNATNSGIYIVHEANVSENASADGVDYYTVTVIARDAFNSTASNNITVYFEIDKGNLSNETTNIGSIQNITCVTGYDGSCKVYWMSFDWGNANITAYINGSIVGGSSIEAAFKRVVFDDNLTIVDFTPSSKKAHVGDLIRYTVKIENNIAQDTTFRLNNLIPKGFSFVEGSVSSSTANGTVNSTIISAHEFNAENLIIYSDSELTMVYILRVGAGAKKGTHKSYAEAFKALESISNRAATEVEITGDPMLDESLIFGTVYADANANGMQDEGEIGIPGVRIVTAEGYIITTDQFGRYHLLNILGGEWGIGRNFIMKVDESSLPKGSTFTTANPLLRRLTPGIPVRFDFGVKLINDVRSIESLMRSSAAEGGAQ